MQIKILSAVILLILSFQISLAQVSKLQSLVILPETLKTEYGLSSLCLNLFKDGPIEEVYKSETGERFNIPHYSTAEAIRPNTTYSRPIFLRPENASFEKENKQFKKFVLDKIKEYQDRYPNPGEFGAEQLYQLQDEIWTYNGLEEFGYIRQGVDPNIAYIKGAKKFSFRYGITDEIDDLNFSIKNEQIIDKLYQLHKIKINGNVIPTVSNIEFNINSISYSLEGIRKSMPVKFVGFNGAGFLQNNSLLINANLKAFIKDFKTDPTLFMLTKQPANYLLTFSDFDYIRQFLIPNNSGVLLNKNENNTIAVN